MSDRKLVLNQSTGARDGSVELFMDGESGTWRLFIFEGTELTGNVDFSRAHLWQFTNRLIEVLAQIESDPDDFDAEVRRSWEYQEKS